jgi:uncharacterized protein YqeY
VKDARQWKATLRAALSQALRAREADSVAVLRETLAAIDNAEAASLAVAPPVEHGVIAGGVAGLGAGEVSRLVLGAEAATEVVRREARERREAAALYASLGRHEEAGRLARQHAVLDALLG